MNYRVLNWRLEGIFGGELRFASIDAVCHEVNYPRGWESLEQMHAATRKWAESARPGDVFVVTPIAAIVAAESPTRPTGEPDGDGTPCDMACPGCEQVGHVSYRVLHISDFASGGWRRDFRYECRECGHAWRVEGEAP